MAKKIEGYISKKVVRFWLENYQSLQAGDRSPDAIPGNSGPKAYDGVSANQLNKLMLDEAIDNLPMLTKACCKARWVHRLAVNKTLRTLEIDRGVYYNRCRQAISLIHKEVNGERLQYMQLLAKIENNA